LYGSSCWNLPQIDLERYGDGYENLIRVWLARQMERTFDSDSGLMNRQADDGATLAARLYEAVRLGDYELKLEKSDGAGHHGPNVQKIRLITDRRAGIEFVD
jgi:hypothetical protein